MNCVSYLGPEGSYSHLASQKLCVGFKGIACKSFKLVIDELLNGGCDFAVLPIENSLNGAVLQSIDLLQATENVIATKELSLPLDHRLATLTGADKGGIWTIYSHEQPLAQCGEYLSKNFPQAKLIATNSTTASLEMLKTVHDGAIVGAHVKREGISLSPRNIADSTYNYTNFLLVERGSLKENKKSEKIFFSLTCPHSVGALVDILEPMRRDGLNMTKIQSRPIKDKAGEYRFFIEVEGDYSSKQTKDVLLRLKNMSLSFKILGAY